MKTQAKQAKRIRTGDTIVVTCGNDRGKSGQVLKRVGNNKLLIQGINMCKKAIRPGEANPQGGFVELERPIHASNVLISDGKGNGFRAKARNNGNLKEVYGVVNGQEVVHRTYAKSQSKDE